MEGALVAALLALLGVLFIPAAIVNVRKAKKVGSLSNLRTFVQADLLYWGDKGEFPLMNDTWVPSRIPPSRLKLVADYCDLPLPGTWPRSRRQQPSWVNDPIARDSGYAEGMDGGLYTGYVYLGRSEETAWMSALPGETERPKKVADRKNLRRGVLWTTLLAEFNSSHARRFECFHFDTPFAYPDFTFHKEEIDGYYRGWSDGSAEWISRKEIPFTNDEFKINHFLGRFFF